MTRFLTTIALLCAASTAFAGYQSSSETYIHTNSDGSGNASAVLTNVHDSSDIRARSECMLRGDEADFEFLVCTITEADGGSASCYTYDANMINAARGLSDASRMFISFDSAGLCTQVGVTNGSPYL